MESHDEKQAVGNSSVEALRFASVKAFKGNQILSITLERFNASTL